MEQCILNAARPRIQRSLGATKHHGQRKQNSLHPGNIHVWIVLPLPLRSHTRIRTRGTLVPGAFVLEPSISKQVLIGWGPTRSVLLAVGSDDNYIVTLGNVSPPPSGMCIPTTPQLVVSLTVLRSIDVTYPHDPTAAPSSPSLGCSNESIRHTGDRMCPQN